MLPHTEIMIAREIQTGSVYISNTLNIMKLDITAPRSPPKNPSIVFLGETLSSSLFLPSDLPMIYAKVSLHQINTKTPTIIYGLNTPLENGMSVKKTKPLMM